MEFALATADLGDGAYCIEVAGEADLATSPELKAALAEAIESGARSILVDFSAASFIDSTALGVLMGVVKRLRPVGGALVIVCSDPNIRRAFQITLLDRIFSIFETRDAGLARLREQPMSDPVDRSQSAPGPG
jgi:anti-sigma B factor antagonist